MGTSGIQCDLCWKPRRDQAHDCRVRLDVFAQSILEYSGVGSGGDIVDSLRSAGSALMNGLRDLDPRTWWVVGGLLVVLMFLTRHSRQH
jgi:hypothetical protein